MIPQNLLLILNILAVFNFSIFIYYVGYYSLHRIVYKSYPKTHKDLEIETLKERISNLQTQNQQLSEENQKISDIIIRKIQ